MQRVARNSNALAMEAQQTADNGNHETLKTPAQATLVIATASRCYETPLQRLSTTSTAHKLLWGAAYVCRSTFTATTSSSDRHGNFKQFTTSVSTKEKEIQSTARRLRLQANSSITTMLHGTLPLNKPSLDANTSAPVDHADSRSANRYAQGTKLRQPCHGNKKLDIALRLGKISISNCSQDCLPTRMITQAPSDNSLKDQ